jgi:hypothetical protein
MTLIVYSDGAMAADDGIFCDSRREISAMPKVVCSSLGLFGAAGDWPDTELCHDWFMSGMGQQEAEELRGILRHEKGGESVTLLWVKADGSVWRADGRLHFGRVRSPEVIGEPAACAFAMGALSMGAGAELAVSLASQKCVWVGPGASVVRLKDIGQ